MLSGVITAHSECLSSKEQAELWRMIRSAMSAIRLRSRQPTSRTLLSLAAGLSTLDAYSAIKCWITLWSDSSQRRRRQLRRWLRKRERYSRIRDARRKRRKSSRKNRSKEPLQLLLLKVKRRMIRLLEKGLRKRRARQTKEQARVTLWLQSSWWMNSWRSLLEIKELSEFKESVEQICVECSWLAENSSWGGVC